MTFLVASSFFEADIATFVAVFASVLTLAFAFIALLYAKRELANNRDAVRIDLTARLYEHQLSPEFAKHIAITVDFLTIDPEGEEERRRVAEERWTQWTQMDRDGQTQIVLYLNHLEAVANLFKLKRLDREATMRLFGQAAASYWGRADWFIACVREEYGDAIFDKWEFLASEHGRWKAERDRREAD